MERITSTNNIKVKEAVKLKSARARHETASFLAEGIKLIQELNRSGYKILHCFVKDGADMSMLPSSLDKEKIYICGENIMKKISSLTTPQDFIAVCKIQKAPENICGDFILALDRLQDPTNLGAILRSAEAFGIKDIVLGDGCCDVYSPKALRSAMGSIFRLNIINASLTDFLTEKKKQGYDIIGTGLDKDYKTVDKLYQSPKKVLIIGNEGNGISKEIQDKCSFGMYIPMYGDNESLNAAVAASIIMWENKRQSNE